MESVLNTLYGKRKTLLTWILVSLIGVVGVAFSMAGRNEFDIARREVLLRRIGHEILLQSGDSASRVLPVEKTGAHEYRISFEKAFTFEPDSLVNTTRRLLSDDPLSTDYVVNVRSTANSGVTYGFAISSNIKNDIVACKGRKQPTAEYLIDIKFKNTDVNTVAKVSLLGSLPVLAFVGFIFLRSVKRRKIVPNDEDPGLFHLGSILFDVKNQQLTTSDRTVDLTGTETRILLIFALCPNEIVERSRLQKEIWEDEGIIVGRSLDMFISKLRKKLEYDPNLKIAVIRGKGYKLEIRP